MKSNNLHLYSLTQSNYIINIYVCVHTYTYIQSFIKKYHNWSKFFFFIQGQYFGEVWLLENISSKLCPPTEYNMTKNCMYSDPCSKGYKGKNCCPLKVRWRKHWKAVSWGKIKKLGMADHIWKEKGNHLPLWDEVKIIDKEEYWRIRCLKEAVHMLGYNWADQVYKWIQYGN